MSGIGDLNPHDQPSVHGSQYLVNNGWLLVGWCDGEEVYLTISPERKTQQRRFFGTRTKPADSEKFITIQQYVPWLAQIRDDRERLKEMSRVHSLVFPERYDSNNVLSKSRVKFLKGSSNPVPRGPALGTRSGQSRARLQQPPEDNDEDLADGEQLEHHEEVEDDSQLQHDKKQEQSDAQATPDAGKRFQDQSNTEQTEQVSQEDEAKSIGEEAQQTIRDEAFISYAEGWNIPNDTESAAELRAAQRRKGRR